MRFYYGNKVFRANLPHNAQIAIFSTTREGNMELMSYLFEKTDLGLNPDEVLAKLCTKGYMNAIIHVIEKYKANPRYDNYRPVQEAMKNGHLNVIEYFMGILDPSTIINVAHRNGYEHIIARIREKYHISEETVKMCLKNTSGKEKRFSKRKSCVIS